MRPDDTPNSEVDNLHRELDKTLNAAAEAGKEIVKKGHEIAAEGQSVVDWADATRQAFANSDDPNVLGSQVQNWSRVNSAAEYLNSSLMNVPYQILSSTTYAANAGSMIVLGQRTRGAGTDASAAQRIRNLAARPEEYKSVSSLLEKFGFCSAHGNLISAYQQFETAHREYEVNAASGNQASSWLIPMRECILTVFDCLLKQTQTQRKQKGTDKKVEHILTRLSRAGGPDEHIKNLAHECRLILDEGLSPSKQKSLSRSQSESILLSATLWLKSFLSLIDPDKLRKTAR